MSQANIELVRQVYEDFAQGRAPSPTLGDDVEWQGAADLPDRDVHRGRRAAAAMVAE
jgi:hypothetical protein